MSENTVTQTGTTPETPRTFYRTDYAKAAKLVRNMRHVRCAPSTPKADQSRVDTMATVLASLFAEDAPEGAFDHDKFLAGTQLPVQDYPSYPGTGDEGDGTEDEPDADE